MSQAWQWQMTAPETPLTRVEVDIPAPGPEEAVVKVAGCGVCHTDIGFLYGGVRTRHALPLALGHEVSGYVVDAGEAHRALVGKAVVVPAVVPCGECEACKKGHGNICAKQQMPGNDVHGGFASHLVVPAKGLCVVPVKGEGPDATYLRKMLQLNFYRPGDTINQTDDEIRFGVPAFEDEREQNYVLQHYGLDERLDYQWLFR